MVSTVARPGAARLDGGNPFATMLALATALALAATVLMASPSVPLPALPMGGPTTSDAQLQEAIANLPLTFVENRGQADPRNHYQAHGPGYAFAFRSGEVALSLRQDPTMIHSVAGTRDAVSLSLRFLGANPDVLPEGAEPTGGVVNYVRGNDPAAWHTALPTFGAVIYRELWPGIDLLLRGDSGELKYEFRVSAGARPDDIQLRYAGATGLALDHEGGLVVGTPAGDLRDSAPIAYHDVDGAQVPVDAQYVVSDGGARGEYGFALGADYHPEHPLVIDPGLDYSTFLGGSSHELAGGIAVDADGKAVVVGTTQSDDFPTTSSAVDGTFNGGVIDVFVAKLDADGSGLVYATYLGGTPTPLRRGTGDTIEFGRAVTVDANGNAYITGQTTSSDFPTTSGSFQPSLNATPDEATDAFVTKLSPTGGLVYSTFLGGGSWEDGRDIAVDASDNAYVVGETGSGNFPATSGAIQVSAGGGRDAFIAKFNAAGSALLYATYLGGAETDTAAAIGLDASGSAYVAGSTRSVEFPTTAGSFQREHSGGEFVDLFEVFAAKLDPSGSSLEYSTFLGGTKRELANDVAVDAAGHAYVTGGTLSPEFPTTSGAFDTVFDGTSEGFVTKLRPDGSGLAYSTFMRGGSFIAVDANDNAWLAGGQGVGGVTTSDAFAQDSSGGNDAYLARLNAAGSALEFATYIGGSENDRATAVALGPADSVYITGNSLSADFPTTAGAFDRTWDGDVALFWGDAFVAKFASDGDGDTSPPPASRDTTTFSGRIDKNETITHNLSVPGTGQVDIDLDWDDSRVDLDLRVRDPSGNSVFFDDSTAKPKIGTFTAEATGTYRFEITNTTSRNTDYTLSVTYPSESTSTPPSAGLSTVELSPTSVTGGTSSTGTVTLTAGAPSGGASVLLSSSNTAVATVPSSATVAAGETSATFTVSTSSVSVDTSATISATYDGVTRTADLAVTAEAGATLSTLSLNPTTVTGGESSTGTVHLTSAAPSGGADIVLDSSNTAVATVPESVTVPAGETSATFTVSTSAQDFDQSSAISASYGGVTDSVILSVTASQSADTVTISRAEYDSDKDVLRVEADSSDSGATLRAYVTATDELIGTLSDGRGEFSWPTNPENVTVRSSLGGSATRSVTLK